MFLKKNKKMIKNAEKGNFQYKNILIKKYINKKTMLENQFSIQTLYLAPSIFITRIAILVNNIVTKYAPKTIIHTGIDA